MGVAIQCGTVAAILDNKHCIRSAGLGLPIVGLQNASTVIKSAAITYRQLHHKMFPADTFIFQFLSARIFSNNSIHNRRRSSLMARSSGPSEPVSCILGIRTRRYSQLGFRSTATNATLTILQHGPKFWGEGRGGIRGRRKPETISTRLTKSRR